MTCIGTILAPQCIGTKIQGYYAVIGQQLRLKGKLSVIAQEGFFNARLRPEASCWGPAPKPRLCHYWRGRVEMIHYIHPACWIFCDRCLGK